VISSSSTPNSQPGGGFSLEVLDERPGILIFRVDGKRATETFANEAGGHRWQRIPPTEKRGRVQTSTVTVAVLPVPTQVEIRIDPKDLEETTCRGSGPGGQHRNMTDSAVQVKHKPTGLIVRSETEKSQHLNRRYALDLLRARLQAAEVERMGNQRDSKRRSQIGSGQRGDKRRTIRVRDGVVRDHILNKKWKLKSYLRGDWD
jgi:peptide chain release factor 1